MQTISFDFQYSQAHKNYPIPSRIPQAIKAISDFSFIHDIECYDQIQRFWKVPNALLVLVGIGGSSLGAQAIISALAPEKIGTQFYCADTVDSDHIATILQKMQYSFAQNHPVFLVIVSKSGTTLETMANGQILLSCLQKNNPLSWHENCLIITDKDSRMWGFGKQHNCPVFAVPKNLSGRFSVFSPAGLIPCFMMGIDTAALLRGASDVLSICKQEYEDNPAALTASALYNNYSSGYTIHDTFIFSSLLQYYGAWYRQLLAESIGKKFDNQTQEINVGITPTVSIGTTDLHSIGQLNIAGPKNKYTTFITLEKNSHSLQIPTGILAPELAGLSLTTIMHASAQGTIQVYEQEKLPFNQVSLSGLTAYSLGTLMQYNMLTIALLGYLFDINTFDQPEVEKYKVRTRKALNL